MILLNKVITLIRNKNLKSSIGMSLYRVAIIGSGNWGSAIAKLVGYNVTRHPTYFHSEVTFSFRQHFLIFRSVFTQLITVLS